MVINWFCVVTMPDGVRHVLMFPESVDSTQRARAALKARMSDGKLRLDDGSAVELPESAAFAIASTRDCGVATTQRVPKTDLVFDDAMDFPPPAPAE